MSTPPAARPSGSMWPAILKVLGGFVVLVLLAVAGAVWYVSTQGFHDRVKAKVISTIEDATGGRVELGGLRWRLLHLEVEVDNLTIHGLEAPSEVPYAHVDRVYVRAKIVSLFEAKIGLNYLEADRPVLHLIVYPDGTTNQPKPRTPSNSNKSVPDTLLDLAIDRAEVDNGTAIVNQRAMPFDLSANDVGLMLSYASLKDQYLAALQVADISAVRGHGPVVHSNLAMQIVMGRNALQVPSLDLKTGPDTLHVSAALTNFNAPQWTVQAKGSVNVGVVEALTAIPGLEQGIANLAVQGQGQGGKFAVDGNVRVAGAAYVTSFLSLKGVNASTDIHASDQELALTSMNARLAEGGAVTGEMHILNWLATSPVPASAVTKGAKSRPTVARPAKVAPALLQKGTIRADIEGVTLASIMRAVAPPRYQDLGFDTAATGKANVDWVGDASDLTTEAKVILAPPKRPTASQVPLSGLVDAKYFNRGGAVQIAAVDVRTPGTHLHVQGALGVYPVSQASALQADLNTANLGEFDRTLSALGLSVNGKNGVQAIPIQLHGQADFHGSVTGTIIDPDVKGHLTATNFDTNFFTPPPAEAAVARAASGRGSLIAPGRVSKVGVPTVLTPVGSGTAVPPTRVEPPPAPASPPPAPAVATAPSPAASAVAPPATALPPPAGWRDIHWDRLEADAEYSPQSLAIGQATLTRATTVIKVSGLLRPHVLSAAHRTFDAESPVSAQVSVQKAALADVLVIAGSTLPISGVVGLQATVGGRLGNLSGGGSLNVQGGSIYGEPYHSLNAALRFSGQEVDASRLTFLQNGGRIDADGGYDLGSDSFHFNASGKGFELAHIQKIQSKGAELAGSLSFEAHGSGKPASPSVNATMHLNNLTVGGQAVGSIVAEARTDRQTLFATVESSLENAKLQARGQIALTGDYQAKAELTLDHLDVTPLLKSFNVQGLTGQSTIGATASVEGPLKTPRRMGGEVTVNEFSVAVGGVPLQTVGGLHAQLSDGVLRLDPLHITGDDTNLHAQGTVDVMEAPYALNMQASGAVNLKLAQTVNPDITSSGHVDFTLNAGGSVQKPDLTGQVKFTNVAASLEDLPNGLSQMNGTLTFDQDRLEVQNLTAMTGGGQLKLGGYVTYQQGVYMDMTATGKDIRIRYPQGISSVADAQLHFQGAKNNLLLSGNILVTRFAINPNLDLAAFSSGSGSVASPTDSNTASNHVRLDVRITSSPELNFQNSYAKLAGDVDLRVGGTVATPSVLGHISVTEGSATFAGTEYQLQRGDIYFTNPVTIDPVIDLDATAHVEEYDVTIGLHGTPSKLDFTYRSEPPLPQADIFALLALGRTQEEQQIYSNQQQQAGVNSTADALLGGALNATVSSRIQKLFGGGNVKIDPTFVGTLGNSTARITVEQQVSHNATLTYATNVNSTSEQLIQGQIDVTRNVSLVAVRDESGVFSVVVKVRKRLR